MVKCENSHICKADVRVSATPVPYSLARVGLTECGHSRLITARSAGLQNATIAQCAYNHLLKTVCKLRPIKYLKCFSLFHFFVAFCLFLNVSFAIIHAA